MGFLCSLAGIYSFTYGVSHLITPITNYLLTTAHPKFTLTLTDFILFHIADYFFIILFASLLSVATGKKVFWFNAFVIGTLAIPFSRLIIYPNQNDILSGMTIGSLSQLLISRFLLVPVIAWMGLVLGNKYRIKRQNITIGSDGRPGLKLVWFCISLVALAGQPYRYL